MGQGQHSITYEEALKLTEGASDVHRVLAENAPKRPVGRPSKKNPTTDNIVVKRTGGGTTALAVRLAQEKPKFYDAYLRGDYKTITAAATAAGILKDDLNLRRAKSAFRCMTAAQREEFLKWMNSSDAREAKQTEQ